MTIQAHVHNQENKHAVRLTTNGTTHSISIPPKSTGFGSSANGGELLFLALATCYCNDVYREAAKKDLEILAVEVEVTGDFGGIGDPATNVRYNAKVKAAHASKEQIQELLRHTDSVAEIQNTLRAGAVVELKDVEVEIV